MSAEQGSILVKAPIGSVYRKWVQLPDFPKFMTMVKEVQELDANHFLIAVAYTANGMKACSRSCCEFPSEGWLGECWP